MVFVTVVFILLPLSALFSVIEKDEKEYIPDLVILRTRKLEDYSTYRESRTWLVVSAIVGSVSLVNVIYTLLCITALYV